MKPCVRAFLFGTAESQPINAKYPKALRNLLTNELYQVSLRARFSAYLNRRPLSPSVYSMRSFHECTAFCLTRQLSPSHEERETNRFQQS